MVVLELYLYVVGVEPWDCKDKVVIFQCYDDELHYFHVATDIVEYLSGVRDVDGGNSVAINYCDGLLVGQRSQGDLVASAEAEVDIASGGSRVDHP